MVKLWAGAFLAGVSALAWNVLPAAAQDRPLQVVATTGMIADAMTRIGGEAVEVTALMGAGVDPHSYRQTRADILAMGQADLVVWHGLYLEAQLEDFMADLASHRPVVALADSLPVESLRGSEDYEGRYDPHVWMDPALWQGVVTAARDALIAVDPEGAEGYGARAEAYAAEIAALDAYAEEVLASVPDHARVLVTAHDAFGYFGAAYEFEVLGVQGLSTESEAGLARIEDLVTRLVTDEIGAVFVESSVSDRNLRALIEGADARGHDVAIGGQLYSDAMGNPGTYEGSYIGMIDHNVTQIARALGGEAPETGMQGLLGEVK